MKVVLELQDQPSNIKKVTVRHDIVIGRGAECNLRLSAPQVSRRHCFLRVGADCASITDLESSNGTFIDGQRITAGKRYMLTDGMAIAVGPIKFVTRVQTEVVAGSGEFLKVVASGGNVEVDSGHDSAEQHSGVGSRSGSSELSDSDRMKMSVEHAGLSADEDEPTAGYYSDSGNAGGSDNLGATLGQAPESLDSEAEIVDLGRQAAARDASIGFDAEDDPETVADVADINELGSCAAGRQSRATQTNVVEIIEHGEVLDEQADKVVDAKDDDVATGSWFSDKPNTSNISSSDEKLNDFLQGLP